MFSATTFKIRDVRVEDVPELVRLGWATEEDWPSGQILVGEIHGVVAAALAIEEQRAVTAAVPGAPYLLAHMRARAAGSRPTSAPRRSPTASASGCAGRWRLRPNAVAWGRLARRPQLLRGPRPRDPRRSWRRLRLRAHSRVRRP